jgi:hypothetical protein
LKKNQQVLYVSLFQALISYEQVVVVVIVVVVVTVAAAVAAAAVVVVVVVMSWTCILKVLGTWFSSILTGKCWDSTFIRP